MRAKKNSKYVLPNTKTADGLGRVDAFEPYWNSRIVEQLIRIKGCCDSDEYRFVQPLLIRALGFQVRSGSKKVSLVAYVQRMSSLEVFMALMCVADTLERTNRMISNDDHKFSDRYDAVVSCQSEVWNQLRSVRASIVELSAKKGLGIQIEEIPIIWGGTRS
jgi:hypothetical protein